MAAGTGPTMQVRVDGSVVDTIEVRETEPTDYNFTVPSLKAGSKVDIVFANDAFINGQNRDLIVTHLFAKGALVFPSDAAVVYDRGNGNEAFDGINTLPGQGAMGWNGALRVNWPEPNLTGQITVRASGTLLQDIGPKMSLRINGLTLGSVEVRTAIPTDYVFGAPAFSAGARVDVVHTNHASLGDVARHLVVHYARSANSVLLPASAGNVFDLGSGLAAFDGVDVVAARSTLNANGALRATWPAMNMTDTLTVRASGAAAGGIAPVMQVSVDGVVLGSVDVRGNTPTDFTFPTLPLKPGSQVETQFINPGSVGSEVRRLQVSYAIAGKTYLLADNGSLRGAWPEPNLTDTLTVRARGSLAGDVGPIMQVLVDGVLVFATEVRSTDFTDFTFPAPAMQPGRKVDVVFTNDAIVGTADRNLFVAYLLSGSTYLLPTNSGNTIDRGVGNAAFDGVDAIPGHGNLAWSGALRTTWPQPNITSTVTVRASGTLAGNVGPIMRLWVDGVAVSSTEVRSTTPTDYIMPSAALKPGSRVGVSFDNPGSSADTKRELNIAYLLSGATVLRLQAAATADAGNAWQAAWPAANLTETLVVRAHGTVAGGVGASMQVVVDGIVVGVKEVRDADPTDYSFSTPPIGPGTRVDLVFDNDEVVGGVDRNLFISQLASGKTIALPGTAGNTIDLGKGAAAFDGVNVIPGQSALGWNGALRILWPEPNLTDRITIRASGSMVDNQGPLMLLRVNGMTVGTIEVRSAQPADFVFAVPAFAAGARIDVAHTNHVSANGNDRNLNVHYLRAGNTVMLPTAGGNKFDLGSGLAAFDWANFVAARETLDANGALRATWPATNMTDTLTVRASGAAAGGIAPVMQVSVDGVVLESVDVRGNTPTDFTFPTLPLKPGSQVETQFINPGSVGSEVRRLQVNYAIAGKTYLLADNGSLRGAWPEPNLTDTLTVRAKGSLAGNVGPIMQVLVDGVLVFATEVRSTDFTDFTFPAPAMQPGRKVDVVFTNDAIVGTADRNLFVAYLLSGSTYMLPGNSGNTIDRGVGNAAFDGVDAIPGHGNLAWSGALRTTWPQPNITSTVTVRASGTLAGNVGPIMRLWVDGVAVSSTEVRSTTPTDYIMPSAALKPGSKIDLVYENDGIVDGTDRNLQVNYLLADRTYMLPNMSGVRYDLGTGNAALDGLDTLPGQGMLGLAGALRMTWPTANLIDTITVRARADLAGNVGALMQVRVDGVPVGTVEVRSTTGADHVFTSPRLSSGSRIDVVFLNDQVIAGQDRNLHIQYIKAQGTTLVAAAPNVQFDSGWGEAAFDGLGTSVGSNTLASNGALRFTMPAPPPTTTEAARNARYAASRFLQQASFGPTLQEIERLAGMPYATWLSEQMAMPAAPDFVSHIQAKYDLGPAYRPQGSLYNPTWLGQRFWAGVATGPDVLRKRVAFALHQIFMVSQADTGLYDHARAYAAYLDILNRHAFGNFRVLLEDVALSPAMGIYLSHIRNRKEDPLTGRMPDENFAREVMQLFTIGLHELNQDGTPQLDSQGNPVETYSNTDVMAMAKVFTGWSWAFPDSELTEAKFRWAGPDYSPANDTRLDMLPMKPYPGQHSTAEKRLFVGKPNALLIPANTPAKDSLRMALDALFNHPNVGPFIGRQLIQRLVTSNPSPAYVSRVAAIFNNNGAGIRGDLGAVLRAVLLDPEALSPPVGSVGKLREPVHRVGHWLRSFSARSGSGQWLMAYELDNQSQRALFAPSVFGYFRPGFVPPNTPFAINGTTVPEMQIVNESTTAQWVNSAMAMAGNGLGWTGTANDVAADMQPLALLSTAGDVDGLIERLNLLLYAGRMSATLKQDLLEAITGVPGNDAASHTQRARVATFIALASPEYLVQR